ncbi:MAG: gamma-glutamyl-gamma-aminobutyrate hydrolase family protein [Phycisphaerae bacterium]|nr:gamma-glutamyl-gamma-aminobutyrate hydrolase family protein [Phycisphaerae bacterium]
MRPVIGITSSFNTDTNSDPPRDQFYLVAAYADAVLTAGGLPMPLPVPPVDHEGVHDDLLARVDGLLFTGGPDLNPARYNDTPHPQTEIMDARRDAFDVPFFRRADAARVPILAICLGFQEAHVARGGRLIQHVDDVPGDPLIQHHLPKGRSAFHTVRIAPDSRLARIVGATEIEVNSRHHQAAQTEHQGRGLRPVAFAPDGLLEASEDCDGRFLLAVQWHPENLIDRPEHLSLFQALVDAARRG